MLIKNAILMPEAKEDEVTIVEVESVGFNKTKVDRMMNRRCCSTELDFVSKCSIYLK